MVRARHRGGPPFQFVGSCVIRFPSQKSIRLLTETVPQTVQKVSPKVSPKPRNSKADHSSFAVIRLYKSTSEEWAMRDLNPRHPRCKRGALAN